MILLLLAVYYSTAGVSTWEDLLESVSLIEPNQGQQTFLLDGNNYYADKPIVIKAGVDIRIVGSGTEQMTRLAGCGGNRYFNVSSGTAKLTIENLSLENCALNHSQQINLAAYQCAFISNTVELTNAFVKDSPTKNYLTNFGGAYGGAVMNYGFCSFQSCLFRSNTAQTKFTEKKEDESFSGVVVHEKTRENFPFRAELIFLCCEL